MMGFLKQAGSFLVGQMAGSNRKADFVVKTLRVTYVVNGGMILVIWYSAWRNERVPTGSGQFPFPGWKKLKRQYRPDRPEKELDRPAGSGPRTSEIEPGVSPVEHGTANGQALMRQHPELKPGIARIAETVLHQFPGLQITATTNGTHVSDSYHYKGRAVDLAGSTAVMNQAAKWINRNLASHLTEGIHNPGLSIKYGKQVSSSYWGSETWAAHANHIHLAV